MMRAFASLIRLTGFGDLFLHYVKIVAVLGASAIAATSQIDGMLLFLIVFSISAEVFAFVVNDLSDVQVDSMNINTRNPLAAGMMDKRTATSVAIIFLIISVSVLMLLPSRIVLLGIAGLFLSLTYSWRIRAKFRPLLDVIYHSSLNSLPFFMGYMLYKPFDETCLLASFGLCIIGVLAELMQEIRDYDSDKALGKTTVVVLGKRRSLTICLVLLFVLIYTASSILDRLPLFPIDVYGSGVKFQFIVLPPLFFLLMKPLVYGIAGEVDDRVIYERFRRRALSIFMIVVCSSAALTAYSHNTSIDIAISSTNYSFDVEVWTIVAGKEDWAVPWILFDHIDQSNFYYLVLHKDGVLELGRTVNGKYEGYIASLKTNISPFQLNRFHISLDGTSIQVILEKEYRLTAPRTPPDSISGIRIPSVYLSYIGNLHTDTIDLV